MITVSTSSQKKPGYHHGDLREALIAATLAILEEGVEPAAFSLREAARRAGVSAMAPYRHFADKDALLAAAATIGFERLKAALEDAGGLDGQGVAYVAFACDHPALFRLMFGAKAPAVTSELVSAADATFRVLEDGVAAERPTTDQGDLALACWAKVHGLAMLAIDGRLKHLADTPVVLARRITRLDKI